jgi:hypothetical protein
MTTTTCDCCNAPLEFNHRNRSEFKGDAQLMSKDTARVGEVAVRSFDFQITVTRYAFNCTNFHVCNRCIIDAISRSIPKEVA